MKKALLVFCSAYLVAGFPAAIGSEPLHWVSDRSQQIARASDTVCFNTSNNKFHSLSCIWAKRCTVNCIELSRKEAHKRGGIPCKVCGGGE